MKRRILVIGPGMEIGGVERSLLGLINSINFEEVTVDLFLMSHKGEFMDLIDERVNLIKENKLLSLCDLPIKYLLRKGHFFAVAIRLFAKFFGDIQGKISKTTTNNYILCRKIAINFVPKLPYQYDIALGFFAPHYFLEDRVNADIKVGWVHTDYGHSKELPDVKMALPMWSKLDYIACVSENVKQSFDAIFPTLHEKSIVIENILSTEFILKQAEKGDVSKEMIEDGAIKILSVGRFCTAKAFDEAVIACSVLVRGGYLIKWYLIGYGPDEQLIRDRIQEYHMEENVIILGKKDNPYPYIKACDIYVQPSRYEGKAVTVREAQILNRPVMITRFATSASQIEEGVDGYICEMGVDGIVEGLKYLIENIEVREQLIRNTRRKRYDNSNEKEKLFKLRKK